MTKAVKISVMLCLCLSVSMDTRAGQTVTVKSIKFYGLKYMTRNELMEKVEFASDGKVIRLDLDSLKKALAGARMLRAHRISADGGTLVITVEEKTPEILIVLKKGDRLVPVELDKYGTVLSVNRVHAALHPAVVIGGIDFTKGAVSERVRRLFLLLNAAKVKCPRLVEEISDIEMLYDDKVVLHLKGRATSFSIEPTMTQLLRLQSLVGLLDRKKDLPARAALSGAMALVR